MEIAIQGFCVSRFSWLRMTKIEEWRDYG